MTPESPKHKLAAIMFTDMVGYTALMQEDETKARELIEFQREILARLVKKHDGEVLQYVGDGTFCKFSSAIEAVNAAIDIQHVFEIEDEVSLRIGIHIGDVVSKGEEVYGDGVNVASRLEPLAEPGGICVSGEVYSLIKNQHGIDASSGGTKELKNVKDSLDIYFVGESTGERAPATTDIQKLTSATSKFNMKWIGVAAVVTVLIIIGIKFDFGTLEVESREDINKLRIAVLPFTNMSADASNEFFADGITDDILTQLSKIKSLEVISRTSVMQYKNTTKNLSEIGAELGVATILEGSVRRGGNRVRINAQLIDVNTDKHLWAETYDRNLDDIFAIQSDVALQIADALKARLTSEETESINMKPTENLEAYDFYLKGRSLFYTYERSQIVEAIEMFKKALSLDSSFSLAYSGLSLGYSQYRNLDWDKDEKWIVLAENAAMKAIELNDKSAEAHFALGFVHERRGEYFEMEREMRRVLELNPNHAHAHDSIGDILHRTKGQLEEALREYKLALTLDPFLLPAFWNISVVKLKQGKYNDAAEILLKALDFSEYHTALLTLGKVYRFQGKYERSIEIADSVLSKYPNSIRAHTHLCLTYTSFGKLADARKEAYLIHNLSDYPSEREFTFLYLIGMILIEEGKLPMALDSLKSGLRKYREAAQTTDLMISVEEEIISAIAEIYLRQKNFSSALEEYNKMIDFPLGLVRMDEHTWAMKHYKLGIIHELTNDMSSAIKEYETFLQLWDGADDNIPAIMDAKERLTALKQES